MTKITMQLFFFNYFNLYWRDLSNIEDYSFIFFQKADGLYASLVFDVLTEILLPRKPGVAGVDANVKRFNYNDGAVIIYPNSLENHYTKINYYNRQLARKRLTNPRNYKTKRYKR